MDENKKLSQDEIISNTKNVLRGLETLKNEHSSLLTKMQQSQTTDVEKEGSDQKKDMIKKSLEKIELGLGEAQVKFQLTVMTARLIKQKHEQARPDFINCDMQLICRLFYICWNLPIKPSRSNGLNLLEI